MKTTAHEFRKKPYDVYLEASKGNTVTINHDRHKNIVFELTARDREPLKNGDAGVISVKFKGGIDER